MSQKQEVIVSGMRPTGNLHLGHFHGVIENWLQLQKQHDCYFFVADLHALTTEYQNPGQLRENTQNMILDWLAFGLDPQQAQVFVQSEISEHAELHLLLSMITPLGWLERVPSYKELKNELKDKDLNNYGFLGYPVLQASDVALYGASKVPVGQDQVAHLELAREIIRRFNFLYNKDVFVECTALLTKESKLLGLDGRKMSKSYNNSLYLSDPEEEIRKKIKTAVTDPARVKKTDPGNPEICNVYTYHKIYSDQNTCSEIASACTKAEIGCVQCKSKVADNIVNFLKPFQEKRITFEKDPDFVKDLISSGSKKAREKAQIKLNEVKEVMGLS